MSALSSDKVFAGSIPRLYESHLVPLIFEAYATDLAGRLAADPPARLLELAAGTGVVTRALARTLPAGTEIVATDLNPDMLKQAQAIGTPRPVAWQPADAMKLPFPDGSFDAIACQFGAMFFPDRPKAYAEARRVLKPGGRFLFNVWDTLADNEFADVVTKAVAALWPQDPPQFLRRTPYAYNDRARIAQDVTAAGFAVPQIETVTHRSRADSPRGPAVGFVEGTPLRSEVEARDPARLREATDAAAAAIAARFGRGAVEARMQALVVTARR